MTLVPPIFWIFAAAALGGIFGSFINMAAHRLPRGISTWKRSRSFCPKCEHQLAWFDNIPILSYLFLRGKCHYCRAPIPPRYLYAELVTAGLFAFCAYHYFDLNNGPAGRMPAAWFGVELFLIVDLVLLSVVDFELWLIPVETTLPWIPVGFILAAIFPGDLHPSMTLWVAAPWLNALIDSFSGLAIGAGFLWAVGFVVAVLAFVRNRLRGIDEAPPDAMGLGDIQMLGMFGALMGWKLALIAILIGVFTGATTGIAKILWNKFQHWRLGDKWTPPKPPTFDLPDDGQPIEPMLWTLPLFGAIVLLVTAYLNSRFPFVAGIPTLDQLAPFWLLILIGVMLLIAFPFYLYLKKINRLPGGNVVENTDGKKEEVYQGNYIPFGPSLAFGCLIAVFWDPLLRVLAAWFLLGSTGAVAMPIYHTPWELPLAKAFVITMLRLSAGMKWLARWFGIG